MKSIRLVSIISLALAMLLFAGCKSTAGPKSSDVAELPDQPEKTPAPTEAVQGAPGEVQILWAKDIFDRTKVVGFNILRGKTDQGPWQRINDDLIDIDSDKDGVLQFVDRSVVIGEEYYYQIQVVLRVGETAMYQVPMRITVERPRGLTPELEGTR